MLQNEAQIEGVISEILSPDALTIVGMLNDRYQLSPVRSLGDDNYYSNDILEDLIEPGMSVLDLVWDCDGNEYRSVAVGSEDSGIVCDNIGCRALHFDEALPASFMNIGDGGDFVDSTEFEFADSTFVDGIDTTESYGTGLASWVRYFICSDAFGLDHGYVTLAITAEFSNCYVENVFYTNEVYKPENERWCIMAGIQAINGDTQGRSTSVQFAWFYAYGPSAISANLTPTGYYLDGIDYTHDKGIENIDYTQIYNN